MPSSQRATLVRDNPTSLSLIYDSRDDESSPHGRLHGGR